ncbi:MAG: helix-turn-helix domain-containing protein [Sphingomonas adhaesiva]|uniref:helix-turn-helix domain-containing protein n=1 Tax=Sphingomonas adhaesiva TaxID=28212 RepID=UPI002FF45994
MRRRWGQAKAACARVAAMSHTALLDERAMLGAKRALLYTNLSVAEVGYALGFADPAYFTRFLTRHAGRSASVFRRDNTALKLHRATSNSEFRFLRAARRILR